MCCIDLQGPADVGWRSLRGLLQALIPSLLMNLHIVGLNQIFDVEIDKVAPPSTPPVHELHINVSSQPF